MHYFIQEVKDNPINRIKTPMTQKIFRYKEKNSIDIIQEKNHEERFDDVLKKAKDEVGDENMELNILDYIY